MTHIAITAIKDGKSSDWLEHVSDAHTSAEILKETNKING
jgi:hypothetical protein